MPAGNGTGPMGMGAQTGRAMGYCAGFTVPGYMDGGMGAGMGAGRGRGAWYGRGGGRGWRNRFYATGLPGWQRAAGAPAPEQELTALKAQAAQAEGALDNLRKRITELEAATAE